MSDTPTHPTCALCGAQLTWYEEIDDLGFWVDADHGVDYDPTDHVHRTFDTVPASMLALRDVVAVNCAENPLALPKWLALTLFHIVPVGEQHLNLWFIDYTGQTPVGEHQFTVHSNCAVRRITPEARLMFAHDEADFDVRPMRMPMPSGRYLGLVTALVALAAVFVTIGEALA